MRARALVGAIVFSSLFALMLVVTQAGVLPAESVLVAVSAPQWSNFQPTGWVAGPATTCSIRVFDQDGLIAQGQYRKSTDGGTTWSAESSQGLIVVVDGLNTTGFLTVTNLIFPESQTANQNQIKFSIWNAFGVQMWSDAYSVLVDTGSPTSTVSTSGCYSSTWPGMIHGTAGDSGSGVSFVQIRLRRSDGQYYNGSSWQSSPVWLAATGTSNWSYAFAPQENSYTVFSRATDAVGQHQMTYGSSDFSYDVTAPQSGITTSGCFRADNWTGLIQGTSSDNLSGIASVHLTVHRASDGLYYNGATWGASPTWLPASGTINWSLPLVPSAQTTYTVRSRATDNCGNVQTTPAEASFTYDASSPQSAVQTSGCFNLNGWPGAIYGSASDALSGVAAVEITLRRASDSLYYNGSSWGASPTWLPASGTTSWSFAFTPTVDTVYTVNVRASDNCGNVQSSPSTGSFTYDATAPLSAITTAGCFNSWPVTIQGSASDNLSGLAAVQISLRRASDGRYYDGSSWQPGISWITVSGTALWSFSFAPTVETTYTVNSRATDNCENVQVVPAEATFVYDATAPQSNVLTSGCFNASGWLGTIRGSASDLLSGVHYVQITLQRAFDGLYYNGTSWGPTVTWLPVSGASTWSYPFMPPVESIYTVNSRAADNCGNVQTSYGTSTFSYDTTAPGAPFNLSVTPFGWSQTNAFTLTWNNPADLCGVVAAHFKWNSAPTSNSDVSPGSPVTGDGIHSIVNLSVPTEGAHKLYLWLQDAAGNLSFQNRNVTNEGAFKWDATPPTTYVETVTGTLGCAGWYTTSVQVELAAIDATSGVSATFWRQDGGSWQRLLGSSFAVTGEGPHDIEYYSVDLAGNIEDKHVLSPRIQIDTIPPTTQQPNYAGSPGHNDWYISPV
ncbi:MAG: hypothetical protein FJ026_11965, partial [Chloroflexi bacterium]|nr:hypothetical protein [Chloroflexota bacterium]